MVASVFQKRLTNKQMLKQCVKHYYQLLCSTIHHETKISQSSSDSRIQGPSKRSSSGLLYPVSYVKNHNRKGENVKSLGFYSRLFLDPKPHQRWRPLIDLSRLNIFLLVEERFKWKFQSPCGLSDSCGMGVVDRCLSSHPHPPKLKEVPTF